MTTTLADWLSPADLADELTRISDKPVTAEWVRRQMATGAIPSVKVGQRRWFTPRCREELERRATARAEATADVSGFGRVTRIGRAS